VVSNETVAPLYYQKLLPNLTHCDVSSINLPDGETYKTVATMQAILDALVESRAGRDVCLVALGGGVVGDITGFAAACYMRGVDFIQVPTTLLAQVDSSVGGKTGVNHAQGKNLIGAFHQPQVVLIDTDTLGTLPDRELSAGLAEVIKHGAICDPGFFAWLESNIVALLRRDPDALEHAIRRCCEIKAEVVAEDEREAGRRATLNFGHTFGHAIEHSQGYGEWLHGEAVAAGMIMAAKLSGIEDADVRRLTNLVEAAGLPIVPPPIAAPDWKSAMGMDKKVQGKQLRFVLLNTIGDSYVTSDYDAKTLDGLVGATA
jgi:3-dehydroquinate synthase